jgi:hypothetical protein
VAAVHTAEAERDVRPAAAPVDSAGYRDPRLDADAAERRVEVWIDNGRRLRSGPYRPCVIA